MKLSAPARKITSAIVVVIVFSLLLTVNVMRHSGSTGKWADARRGGASGALLPISPSVAESVSVSKRRDGDVKESLVRLARAYQSGDEGKMHSDFIELRGVFGRGPDLIKDDFGRRLMGKLIVSSDERRSIDVLNYLFFMNGCDAEVVSILLDGYRGIPSKKYQLIASVYLRTRWKEDMRGELTEERAKVLEEALRSPGIESDSSSAATKAGGP